MEPLVKRCPRCEQTKPRDQFNKHRKQYDGLSSWCRTCQAAINKAWRTNRTPEQRAADAERKRLALDPATRAKAQRAYHLSRHGLTLDQYEALLAAQGGVCASCGGTEYGGRMNRFCIDHDHRCCPGPYSCGKCVRGLLCIVCNVVAGHLESPRSLSVMAYLERTRG